MTDTEMDLDAKIKNPLFSTILVWFLLLALLPLGVSNWINYQQSNQYLVKSVESTLLKKSNTTHAFIRNWFDYRNMDVSYQARDKSNVLLLQALANKYQQQSLPLKQFVGSASWRDITDIKEDDLVNFTQRYDYVHDVFLIDKQGNILFTVAKEIDIGTNLFDGPFAKTRFAQAVKDSIESEQMRFSDLERYLPSNNLLSGFLTAPMFDEQGQLVGVFALQLHLKRIFSRLFSEKQQASSFRHYFVGQDKILRSPFKDDPKKALNLQIDTEIVRRCLAHSSDHSDDQNVYEYKNIEGKSVLGVSQRIEVENVSWVLVSEIDKKEVFAPIRRMAISLIVICIISIMLVIGLAVFQARRIAEPINKLIDAVIRVIHGDTEQYVKVESENEVGRLAIAFNTMLAKRLAMDKALKKSNDELHNAMHELAGQQYALDQHAIVAVTDTQGTITFVNERFCKSCGYSKQELLGNNHRIMSSGVHDAEFFKEMYQTIHSGEVWHGQVCNKRKDGELYWLQTTITPFKDDQGNIQSFIEIRTDITEQKAYDAQQQQALITSAIKLNIAKELTANESLSARLVSSLRYMFALKGYGLINRAGLFTYDEQENGLTLFAKAGDLGDNEDAVIADMQEQCASQIVEPMFINDASSSLLIDQGDMVVHGHYIIPIKTTPSDENKAGLLGVLYLFTEVDALLNPDQKNLLEELVGLFSSAMLREKARELLKQATHSAQQSSRLKSEFLASMSHEIRTPMNGVLGMLGLLQSSGLNDDQLHKANLAKDSAESLLVLINDILDFSKVEAGKLELEIIDFNIYNLFGDFAEAMAYRAQDKGLELILDMPLGQDSMLRGDPGRIRQILTNIVGNAIKFTEQGEIKITVKLSKQGKQVALTCSVEDTGIGIPQEKIATLCDSFSQVDASTTRKYGGTGLGLAICKKLSALMEGEIQIRSELGKGSCFTFTAKLKESRVQQTRLPSVDISKLELLIVDDNATNREVLRGQLQQWGATVFEAESAQQALQICEQRLQQKQIFDAAMLDMQMPEMDGAELGKKLRANREFDSMRMVMMTSIANQNEAQFFANLGFDAYFAKPATAKDLYNALKVVVDNGQARQQAFPLVTSDYLQSLAPEQEAPKQIETTNKLDTGNIKLLLVEDNVINQQVAIGVLAELGFNAEIADNGQLALDLLNTQEKHFDLILMDCQMPVLDGYKTTQAIRAGEAGEHNKHLTIVAMTANAMQGDREKCLDAGMNDYLAKPIDPCLLESMLYKWLAEGVENLSMTQIQPQPNSEVDDSVVWDKKTALARVLGKQTLLIELLQTFKQEMPERIKELKSAVNGKLDEEVRSIAHSIKGAAANISGIQLSSFAFQLEKAGKEALSEQYASLFNELELAFTALLESFSSFISEMEAEKAAQQSTELLSEQQLATILLDILARLENSDFIDSEEIEKIENAVEAPELKSLLQTLHEQISMFDLTSAIETSKQTLALLPNNNNPEPES